jgi:hypothetical protein
MRDLTTKLQSWRAAGLVTPAQAQAIAAFEAAQPEPTSPRRSLLAEAIGYVGAALAVAAVGLIVGNVWAELSTGPRLILVALLTLLLAGAGSGLRNVDRPSLQRLTSVLFTGAIAGVAWFAGILATDVASLEQGEIGLAVGGAALVASLPLYLLRRRALHQLSVLVSVVAVVVSSLSFPAMDVDPIWYGLTLSAIGAGWFVLAVGGWLVPRLVGELAGSVLAIFALQATGDAGQFWPLFLAVTVAGGLIALAVVTDRLHHLVVGAVGLFIIVPQLVFRLFGDTLGAPAVMLIIGLLLVLLAVGIGRARREVGGSNVEVTPPTTPPTIPSDPPAVDLTPQDQRREEVGR